MSGLMSGMIQRPSPNHDARNATIDMLVLHYTGMTSAAAALERLCDPEAKVSSHYTIDEDGTVYAHVPEARRAWHAGVSHWAGVDNVNARAIGIELVNPGHEWGYRAFPQAQVSALIRLAHGIVMRHPIATSQVLGHSDVAPTRKEDPGELFPWEKLAQAGIGLWPSAIQSDIGPDALIRYGYDPKAPLDKVIRAFQRHFRPSKLDGEWDSECAQLLASLIRQAGV
jgi:N-acetylmuramoyl-L-alanine amidase